MSSTGAPRGQVAPLVDPATSMRDSEAPRPAAQGGDRPTVRFDPEYPPSPEDQAHHGRHRGHRHGLHDGIDGDGPEEHAPGSESPPQRFSPPTGGWRNAPSQERGPSSSRSRRGPSRYDDAMGHGRPHVRLACAAIGHWPGQTVKSRRPARTRLQLARLGSGWLALPTAGWCRVFWLGGGGLGRPGSARRRIRLRPDGTGRQSVPTSASSSSASFAPRSVKASTNIPITIAAITRSTQVGR